uniref:Uncharacterized protein n=1 Tax=virus sp. ct1Hk25 TaxID=2825803 RepID=A0A8S5RNN5_9VIRU|nr:MAG TPA: hypothetical protein [virus sp. ct1Hk25]
MTYSKEGCPLYSSQSKYFYPVMAFAIAALTDYIIAI